MTKDEKQTGEVVGLVIKNLKRSLDVLEPFLRLREALQELWDIDGIRAEMSGMAEAARKEKEEAENELAAIARKLDGERQTMDSRLQLMQSGYDKNVRALSDARGKLEQEIVSLTQKITGIKQEVSQKETWRSQELARLDKEVKQAEGAAQNKITEIGEQVGQAEKRLTETKARLKSTLSGIEAQLS